MKMFLPRQLLVIPIVLALAAVAAVCLHFLEEIHDLKSFFPPPSRCRTPAAPARWS